jgi:hypothetical protein
MLPLVKRLPVDRGEVFEQRQVLVHGGYVCEDVDAVRLCWRNSWRGPVDSELEVITRRSSRRTVHRQMTLSLWTCVLLTHTIWR